MPQNKQKYGPKAPPPSNLPTGGQGDRAGQPAAGTPGQTPAAPAQPQAPAAQSQAQPQSEPQPSKQPQPQPQPSKPAQPQPTKWPKPPQRQSQPTRPAQPAQPTPRPSAPPAQPASRPSTSPPRPQDSRPPQSTPRPQPTPPQPRPTTTDVTPPPRPAPTRSQPAVTQPEPAFKPASATTKSPAGAKPPSSGPQTPQPEVMEQSVEKLERRSLLMKIIVTVLIIVGLAGLTIGGYYVYKNWIQGSNSKTSAEQQQEKEKAQEKVQQEAQNKNADKDNDGMPDEWEKQHGLNADDSSDARQDKDNDGLSNADEYKYGTNANDPDTDDDGYKDGAEVKNGYNPKGSGKLQQSNNTSNGNDNDNNDNQIQGHALLAGTWKGTLQGRQYIFKDVVMTLRNDGKIVGDFQLVYSDIEVENSALGECDFSKETLAWSCKADVQGSSTSENGEYLLGLNGTVDSGYDELAGTWYIIPSGLTASWMTNDQGTFSLKKQVTT